MNIKAFVDKVLTSNNNQSEKLVLGVVTPEQAQMIMDKIGIDLTGYQRVLDSSGIKHAFKKHGNSSIEAPRGQIAILADDFEKILEIVSSPDSVEYVGKNRIGNDLILYKKAFDTVLCYVEGIRESKKKHRKETYLETMYKKAFKRKNT